MRWSIAVVVLAMVLLFSGITAAVYAAKHEPSVEKGKALFNNPKLGNSGKSCNDCHQNGKGLEKIAPGVDIMQMVNKCITGPLKGKELKNDSVEMRSLVLYLKSLKKKAPTGC